MAGVVRTVDEIAPDHRQILVTQGRGHITMLPSHAHGTGLWRHHGNHLAHGGLGFYVYLVGEDDGLVEVERNLALRRLADTGQHLPDGLYRAQFVAITDCRRYLGDQRLAL